MNEEVFFTPEDVKQNKIYGILSYFGILVIVPILAAKDSLYAKFHSNQGLILLITTFLLNIAGRIISFVVRVMSFGVIHISSVIYTIIGIIELVFFIIGIVNACSGEAKKLPIIGDFTLIK